MTKLPPPRPHALSLPDDEKVQGLMLRLAANESRRHRDELAAVERQDKALADLSTSYERALMAERAKGDADNAERDGIIRALNQQVLLGSAADDAIRKVLAELVATQDARIAMAVSTDLARRFPTTDQVKDIATAESRSSLLKVIMAAVVLPTLIALTPIVLESCTKASPAPTPIPVQPASPWPAGARPQ